MRRPGGPVYLLGRAATPGAAETQQFLSRNGVEFRWVDVDDDPLVRLLGADGVPTDVRLPCVLFADGSLLEGPERFMRTRFVAHQGTTPPVSPEDQQAHLETKRFKHESGHFRFHVVGERILHLDARLFYKHRGLERAAEGKTLEGGLAFASRACAACAVTNGVAYAHACEDALGLKPTAELARARTILSSWNGCGATSTTSPRCAPASGSRPATTPSPRSPSAPAVSTPHSRGTGSSSAASASAEAI